MSMEPTQTIMTLVGSLGFPIAVTVYVLARMEDRINKLTEALAKNTEALGALKTFLETKLEKE